MYSCGSSGPPGRRRPPDDAGRVREPRFRERRVLYPRTPAKVVPMKLARLARVCYRRRWLVVAAWIVGALAVLVLGYGFAVKPLNDFTGGSSHSATAKK